MDKNIIQKNKAVDINLKDTFKDNFKAKIQFKY